MIKLMLLLSTCFATSAQAYEGTALFTSEDIQAVLVRIFNEPSYRPVEVKVSGGEIIARKSQGQDGFTGRFVSPDLEFSFDSNNIASLESQLNLFATGQGTRVEVGGGNAFIYCRNNTMAELPGYKCYRE